VPGDLHKILFRTKMKRITNATHLKSGIPLGVLIPAPAITTTFLGFMPVVRYAAMSSTDVQGGVLAKYLRLVWRRHNDRRMREGKMASLPESRIPPALGANVIVLKSKK
jgi:hypothetical protein